MLWIILASAWHRARAYEILEVSEKLSRSELISRGLCIGFDLYKQVLEYDL